jgi:hypothetical protein
MKALARPAVLLALLALVGAFSAPGAIPPATACRGCRLSRPPQMRCAAVAPVARLRGGAPAPAGNGGLAPLASRDRPALTRLLQAAVVIAAACLLPSAALAAGKTAAASVTAGSSLINPADSWALWTTLIVCAAAGLRAEKTQIGAALSSPLVTMFIALVLVNVGVLPIEAPIYSAINKFLVPLAVPMLLLGADLRKVFRDTGSLLLAFMIGAVATMVSTVAAAAVIPMHSVDGAWKIAAGVPLCLGLPVWQKIPPLEAIVLLVCACPNACKQKHAPETQSRAMQRCAVAT